MTDDRHEIAGDARLRDSKDKQVGIRWPVALDQRLDDLVSRANDAGAGTNRRETLSALLLATDMTGDELVATVREYRMALVRDAPLSGQPEDTSVLQFRSHRPGPRTTAPRSS